MNVIIRAVEKRRSTFKHSYHMNSRVTHHTKRCLLLIRSEEKEKDNHTKGVNVCTRIIVKAMGRKTTTNNVAIKVKHKFKGRTSS